METRKVQKTGGSSYIVSLPKPWAEQMGIKEQDRVGIVTRPDGTLIILPRLDQQHDEREKVFDWDEIGKENLMFRMLVGAYITGFNKITITSKARISAQIRTIARQFIDKAIGLQIIEETPNSLTIKELLNPAEMQFKVWIDRMSGLVASRLEDALRALVDKDAALAKDVIDRDVEVNRLHWILSRQHNLLIRNLAVSERLGPMEKRNFNYSLISRVMERIGDYAVRISENNLHVLDKTVDKTLINALIQAGGLAVSIFKKSIEAFYSDDINDANQIIESVRDLIKKCEAIEANVLGQDPVVGVSLGYINEAIRRTGEYSADLCEYVINFLIDQPPVVKKQEEHNS
ncbi:MAG: AbrB/MazE/SpoVT family DNA-binding domain-containing protein [Candidatus Lokiarchaeota archaeon]|nr:AbrB/MazE/SpoVT family DNA-binding domain-containing protein [Candidatus Lokiarchaeota archaeon]